MTTTRADLRRRRDLRFGLTLALPAVAIVVLLLGYPMGYAVYMSAFSWNDKLGTVHPFVGLGNYAELLTDGQVHRALGRTLYFSLFTVLGGVAVAVLIAVLLNRELRGRTLVRVLLLVPWAVPPVVNGIMWKLIFDGSSGVANSILLGTGLIETRIQWLADPDLAMNVLTFAEMWKLLPFLCLLMLAGLQGIPSNIYKAARIDGANPWQQLKMRKVPRAETGQRVHDAARRLEIEHVLGSKPRLLSGGQRQRVALARAIARRPAVFLFDEPLSNLDALLRDQTRSELKLLHAELGATSVYVTHDQEEAMTLSDRIVVMSRGRLEQYGTPYEIYHQPATEFVASFVGKPRMNLLPGSADGGGRYRLAGSSFTVELGRISQPEVRVGLRPEECALVSVDPEEAHGVVKVLEPLGNASDVIVDLGSTLFTVRVPGFGALPVGAPVRIDAAAATPHVFDPAGGARITV